MIFALQGTHLQAKDTFLNNDGVYRTCTSESDHCSTL